MQPNETKCDPLCSHLVHPFIYLLSQQELDAFQAMGEKLFESDSFCDFADSQKLVKSFEDTSLAGLIRSLTAFFEQHSTQSYFLKLSSISPKDAYDRFHGLQSDSQSAQEGDEAQQFDPARDFAVIQRHIGFLKVGVSHTAQSQHSTPQAVASHCLQILGHSNRIYLDVLFEQAKKPLYVLLLDWKEPHLKSETRCLVAKGRLIAVTQYYTDLTDCYSEVGTAEEVYRLVRAFIADGQLDSLPAPDVSIDVDVSKEAIRIIEYNGLAESDKCLFSKEEVDSLVERSNEPRFVPPFRYIDENGVKKQYSSDLI